MSTRDHLTKKTQPSWETQKDIKGWMHEKGRCVNNLVWGLNYYHYAGLGQKSVCDTLCASKRFYAWV